MVLTHIQMAGCFTGSKNSPPMPVGFASHSIEAQYACSLLNTIVVSGFTWKEIRKDFKDYMIISKVNPSVISRELKKIRSHYRIWLP